MALPKYKEDQYHSADYSKAANDSNYVRSWIQRDPLGAMRTLQGITDDETRELLLKDWSLWCRDDQSLKIDQIQKGIEQVLLLCGRSWGKTRWIAEFLREYATNNPSHRIAVIGKNFSDVKDVIFEGDSGLLSCMTSQERDLLKYDQTKLQIVFPNKAKIFGLPADRPEKMRGPQYHLVVTDELCKYQYPQEVLDQIDMCCRLGDRPLVIHATTPKPIKQIREMARDPATLLIKGPSYANKALTPLYFAKLKRKLTRRLYRQEVLAEILDDNPNALFQMADIDKARQPNPRMVPELKSIVVGVDPAITSHEDSDETGIVVVGLDYDGEYWVLSDASVQGATPKEWGSIAIKQYKDWEANKVIAEVNQGGDMVISTIHNIDNMVAVEGVRASKGKEIRAEPVAALYEQHKVHHVGRLDSLESQLTEWNPAEGRKSPDRLDALVWAISWLSGNRTSGGINFAVF